MSLSHQLLFCNWLHDLDISAASQQQQQSSWLYMETVEDADIHAHHCLRSDGHTKYLSCCELSFAVIHATAQHCWVTAADSW
jgi:hypothetical protein